MDLAAEEYNVAYSVKPHRGPSARPSRSAKKSDSRSGKSSKGSRCCGSSKKSKKLDITEIKQSLSTNCCACCCVLAAYMKEAGKLVSSCLNENPTETRLCELFSELLTVTCNVGNDFFNLIRYIFRFFCVINGNKK